MDHKHRHWAAFYKTQLRELDQLECVDDTVCIGTKFMGSSSFLRYHQLKSFNCTQYRYWMLKWWDLTKTWIKLYIQSIRITYCIYTFCILLGLYTIPADRRVGSNERNLYHLLPGQAKPVVHVLKMYTMTCNLWNPNSSVAHKLLLLKEIETANSKFWWLPSVWQGTQSCWFT